MFALGGLRPKDVGLVWSKIPQAVMVTALFWVVLQIVLVVVVWLTTRSVAAHQSLSPPTGIFALIGGLVVEQMLGNALEEEVVFRGFLLVQLFLKFKRRQSAVAAMILALLVSQAIFSLMHVPHRIRVGVAGPELVKHLSLLFLFGVLYAALYLRTQNLWIVVALHAVFNDPILLIDTSKDAAHLVFAVLALILVASWPVLVKVIGRRSDGPSSSN